MTSATYRYSEAHGYWSLLHMAGARPLANAHDALTACPDWLVNIRTLARIGGYEVVPGHPPPDKFFWFTTDDAGVFTKFVGITRTTND